MSASWCVRDYTGQFVIAGTSWIQGKCSIIKVDAMKKLERRGFTNVIFESDLKSVLDAIHHSCVGVSDFNFYN
jgi:hypothetical protein